CPPQEPTMNATSKDPVLEAELERALAPYRDVLPPDVLEEFRDALEDALNTHPVGSLLLKRLQPPPAAPYESEERERSDGAAQPRQERAPEPARKKDAG